MVHGFSEGKFNPQQTEYVALHTCARPCLFQLTFFPQGALRLKRHYDGSRRTGNSICRLLHLEYCRGAHPGKLKSSLKGTT